MPRLVAALVRHGDYKQRESTPSALQPFPLSANGRQQARLAADELLQFASSHGLTICNSIDCSSLLRAWQTAQYYREKIDARLSVFTDVDSFDSLCERSVGSAANLSLNEINQVIRDDPRFAELPPNWKSDSHYRLPLVGSESLMDAGQRVADHISVRMRECEGGQQDILKIFVGHGAAFRHAACQLGVLKFEDIAALSMHHAKPVYIELIEGVWQHIGGEWKHRQGNDTPLD
ncbi:2,3-bisphosphoglycerate-dependent phosphoglycerate mutase [Zhongshania aliphaticivorans]|uniref:2,3-bisphosphoglycerate-dependent phosphoglycerate mutase n=1 Tax=Zhongshania aliphaticivorans TaxID=1470434 RepID=A0A5S9MW68_9GAMM|nr:histidine phosphatase family protein [Zhongshania aliphaticivorans]CAA0081162.1 2,3-bisphosphoglycerate-dependent phosphoglycerate mutase [Zhongshania aliphaticivorans]CAA0085084.1 2,3-bisphosphoglycerate-dependent phosphoglycerate mutase [Zhongshania aliphaticivorans]